MSIPYIPLYVADYEADTAHLTIEEDGAYMRLLRLCWRTPGCSIPDERDWIMRRLRISESTYDRVVEPIIDEFFDREKGRLFNERLSKEFKHINSTAKKRSNAGKKGGRPRKSLKDNEISKSPAFSEKSKPKAKRKQLEPEPEPYTEVTDVTSDGAGAPLDMRTRLFREGLASIHRQTGRRENQCRAMLGKFLKLAYDDCEKVLNTILQAEQDRVASPEPWIIRVLQDRKGARQNTIELVAAEMMKNDQASTDRDGEETSAIDAFRRLAALN